MIIDAAAVAPAGDSPSGILRPNKYAGTYFEVPHRVNLNS